MFVVASRSFCGCFVSTQVKLPPSACGIVRRRRDIVWDLGNVFIRSCFILNGDLQVCESTLESRSAAAAPEKKGSCVSSWLSQPWAQTLEMCNSLTQAEVVFVCVCVCLAAEHIKTWFCGKQVGSTGGQAEISVWGATGRAACSDNSFKTDGKNTMIHNNNNDDKNNLASVVE